jgi:hypothetical protein
MQARVAGMIREQLQQVDSWRQQNKQDQQTDMQDLERLMLQAVGGVEALQRQLATQEGVPQGQAVGLQQVADWMQEMHASSSAITGYLQRGHEKVDDLATELDRINALMSRDRTTDIGPPPAQLIPRASITFPDGALAKGSSGAFGTVVRAMRDGGAVAVKIFHTHQLGRLDQRDAVKEAVLLSQASHHNVVKCWGLVYDPDSTPGDSIHGSLVMEWVGGGDLYKCLQDQPSMGLKVRVQLAQQVAAGMWYLHGVKMVHGDLKPQNILLQFNQGEEVPVVRSLRNCAHALCSALCTMLEASSSVVDHVSGWQYLWRVQTMGCITL